MLKKLFKFLGFVRCEFCKKTFHKLTIYKKIKATKHYTMYICNNCFNKRCREE